MSEPIYHPPTKFAVAPSMGYFEIDGKPVSDKEAQWGSAPGAVWRESEISKELHLYVGWIEDRHPPLPRLPIVNP